MKKLSAKGQKWLKGFHIVFACMWIGAAVCLALMNAFLKATDGMELYGINVAMKFIDSKSMIQYWGTFQLCTLIFAVFISILKPWKKRKAN